MRRSPKLFFQTTAIIELLLFFAATVVIDQLFFDGTHFRGVAPHPFWLLVVLLSVQYGLREGLLAACASAAMFLFAWPWSRGFEQLRSSPDYVLFNVVGWLVTGAVLGALRNRENRILRRARVALLNADQGQGSQSQSSRSLVNRNAKLELRVAAQEQALVWGLGQAPALFARTTEEVLDGTRPLIETLIRPLQCSIFLLRNDELECVRTAGWRQNDRWQRRFGVHSALYKRIVDAKQSAQDSDPEGARSLAGEGMFAAPICQPVSGAPLGMLKIETPAVLEPAFDVYVVANALCDWIGAALVNAWEHETGANMPDIELVTDIEPATDIQPATDIEPATDIQPATDIEPGDDPGQLRAAS